MENVAIRGCVGMVLASLIAGSSFRQNSVNLSGVFVRFLVMAATITASYMFRALLLVFFFTSLKLTKRGAEKKREIDAHYKGGKGDWLQVLINSSLATALALGVAFLTD